MLSNLKICIDRLLCASMHMILMPFSHCMSRILRLRIWKDILYKAQTISARFCLASFLSSSTSIAEREKFSFQETSPCSPVPGMLFLSLMMGGRPLSRGSPLRSRGVNQMGPVLPD